jgi:hypothetical protein
VIEEIDNRVVITDQGDIINYDQYWDPRLVVVSFKDHDKLFEMASKYRGRIVWSVDDHYYDSIAGILIPNELNQTMFRLVYTEFYHCKQDWWEAVAVDHAKIIADDIKRAKENLEDARIRLALLKSVGLVEYHQTAPVRPVKSSKLLALLKAVRGSKKSARRIP